MSGNYREESTRKRGRSGSKLLVRLFLLDPDKNIEKVTKHIGSAKAISELQQKRYGPPSKEYCVAGDRVEFSFELKNEEFKQKLAEIYPRLQNACFVFLTAGKDNALKELNPGRCCYRCYTPENVHNSERGQGRLYIRIIPENEISPCNHGVPFLKRLRSSVGGNHQLFVPILPKPVATVVPAGNGVAAAGTAVTSLATPTISSVPANRGTESRNLLRNLPVLDISSLPIGFAPVESTPAGQNSGNVAAQTPTVVTLSPMPQVSLLDNSASGSMLTQSQLPVPAIVVSQSASSPGVRDSVLAGSLLPPSQPFRNAVNMVPQKQPTSWTVSQTSSTPQVNSSFNIQSQSQSATMLTISHPPPSQPFNVSVIPEEHLQTSTTVSQTASTPPVNANSNALLQRQSALLSTNNSLPSPRQPSHGSIDILPQNQTRDSATVSHFVSRPDQLFYPGNVTPRSQIPGSAEISDESVGQSSLNTQLITDSGSAFSNTEQGLMEFEIAIEAMRAEETGSQVSNAAFQEFHDSTAQPSNRTAPSPGLNLLATVGAQYEDSMRGSTIQSILELEREKSRIVDFLQNVESTGKLEISLDVLNNDDLLKKLNESAITIHTVKIESTCEVHKVLKKFSLPSSLKVLSINENSLNAKDVLELVRCLYTVASLHELHICHTKFKESSFLGLTCALYNCKNLTNLILTDNSLTEHDVNGLINAFEMMKNLKILNLSKCNLTETQANAILHKHEQAKNIVSLDLSQNALQGNEIVAGIYQLQSLVELDLSHNYVRFSPLPNLEEKHDHLSTQTKVISLSSNHMKPDDISLFCSLIKSDLSKLNLDFNHVGGSIWSLCSLRCNIRHLKVLSLANNDISDDVDGLAFLLSLVRELEDLNLSSNNLMPEDFHQLQTPLSKLTQLKALNLSMNYIGSEGMKAIAEIFKEFRLLERLNMSNSYIREAEVSVLLKGLHYSFGLKHLDLSGNPIDVEALDDDVVALPSQLEELLFSHIIHGEKLFAMMRRLQNLRILHLNKLVLRECDVKALAEMLPRLVKLEELSLVDLVAPGSKTILLAIKSLKNLKKIDLTSIKLIDESALVEMLSSLSSLEELVLTYMIGENMDYKKLFSAIKLLKRLRKISLGGVILPDDGVEAFVDMLSSLSILEDIVFPNFYLLRNGGQEISVRFDALESLRYLRSLDMRGTTINEGNVVKAFARVLTSLQLLEKLALNILSVFESLDEMFVAVGKLKCLKELSVNACSLLFENSVKVLAEVLPSLQFLEKFDLNVYVTGEYEKLLPGELGKLRYLKELSVNFCIDDDNMEAFTHALLQQRLLEKLQLTIGYEPDDQHAKQLFAAMAKLKYLRKLKLLLQSVASFEALVRALPVLELLEDLTLRWIVDIDNEHGKEMITAISRLRYLKKLNLGWTAMPNPGFAKTLAKTLTSLRLLEKLKLEDTYDDDDLDGDECEECEELFIALGKLKHLKELHLDRRSIEITSFNVEVLATALLSCEMLEKIKLRMSRISCIDEFICKKLLIGVCKQKYLKKLHLRWKKITQTNVDDLVEALASLQVLEKLTLRVKFYCGHDCDLDCDDDCDHDCGHDYDDDCYHSSNDYCAKECDHDSYDKSCSKCRHDKYEQLVNYIKTKVLPAVKEMKYFQKFKLDGKVMYSRITDA